MKTIFFIMLSLLPLQIYAMTRAEALEALVDPAFNFLSQKDFELKVNEKGVPLAAANKIKEKSVMASVIGKPEHIDEINLMAAFNKSNAALLMMYMPAVVGAAVPEWKEATEWSLKTMVSLSEQNGGKQTRVSNGKTIEIQLMQFGNSVVSIINITFSK